jgi:hypothetical protein
MDNKALDKKYTDFIENLIQQVMPLLPSDVNELQKNYLITNIKKSATLMASSIKENAEFDMLSFDEQCFYIQVIAEWSFHKEIDLFRSGIPPKHWKEVMNKIWYTIWEVMYACVKNAAPEPIVLSMVERFVNRTYNDAIENLKQTNAIDTVTELKAKEQSNIKKMAQELKIEQNVNRHIKLLIYRVIAAIVIAGIISFFILKFKTTGLVIILTMIVVYHFIPTKRD